MTTENTNTNAAREAGQKVIAAILESYPCPQCNAVEVLYDAAMPGATCDCGRKEGSNERWEIADIWTQMSDEEKSQSEAAEMECRK